MVVHDDSDIQPTKEYAGRMYVMNQEPRIYLLLLYLPAVCCQQW